MGQITAKVFRAGNAMALRLPQALSVKAKSYDVTPTVTRFIAADSAAESRRLKAFRALWGSCPDFPEGRK